MLVVPKTLHKRMLLVFPKQNAYIIRNPIGSWIRMIWITDLEKAESQGGSNGAIGNV